MGRPVVLILRALGLGDGLTGIAALRGLRRAFGSEARLVLAAPAGIGGWLVDRGVVDEVLVTPDLDDVVTSWRAAHGLASPEVAVDLHGRGPRSQRLLKELAPGRLIAWRCPAAGHDEGPEHLDTEHEVLRWCRLLTSTTGAACGPSDLFLPRPEPTRVAGVGSALEGHVLVHPGAASGSRRWPAERFAEVVASLVAGGDRVVLTGSADERALVADIARQGPGAPAIQVLAGDLDLDGLAAVVARARLVVCGDTGVAHLATAYRVPSVLLFGPTPPAEWGPCVDLDRHRVLWHGPRFAPSIETAAGSVGSRPVGSRPAGSRPVGSLPAGYRGDPHGRVLDLALGDIGVQEVVAAITALSDRQRPVEHAR